MGPCFEARRHFSVAGQLGCVLRQTSQHHLISIELSGNHHPTFQSSHLFQECPRLDTIYMQILHSEFHHYCKISSEDQQKHQQQVGSVHCRTQAVLQTLQPFVPRTIFISVFLSSLRAMTCFGVSAMFVGMRTYASNKEILSTNT